eukprot:TRINITY_DN38083_c0_g1_i1.p1 TRINITY_DN38083_c0_g1~~TRINITY_DN38083_c0_g1_i1.p1  ORF type:complete len:589 (+),score=155.45 TRINITY_DN38083_c0_g1_i1:115-1881(+)
MTREQESTVHVVSFRAKQRVELPSGSVAEITYARFGAEPTWLPVTDIVASWVGPDNGIAARELRTRDMYAVDPLPGKAKTLEICFSTFVDCDEIADIPGVFDARAAYTGSGFRPVTTSVVYVPHLLDVSVAWWARWTRARTAVGRYWVLHLPMAAGFVYERVSTNQDPAGDRVALLQLDENLLPDLPPPPGLPPLVRRLWPGLFARSNVRRWAFVKVSGSGKMEVIARANNQAALPQYAQFDGMVWIDVPWRESTLEAQSAVQKAVFGQQLAHSAMRDLEQRTLHLVRATDEGHRAQRQVAALQTEVAQLQEQAAALHAANARGESQAADLQSALRAAREEVACLQREAEKQAAAPQQQGADRERADRAEHQLERGRLADRELKVRLIREEDERAKRGRLQRDHVAQLLDAARQEKEQAVARLEVQAKELTDQIHSARHVYEHKLAITERSAMERARVETQAEITELQQLLAAERAAKGCRQSAQGSRRPRPAELSAAREEAQAARAETGRLADALCNVQTLVAEALGSLPPSFATAAAEASRARGAASEAHAARGTDSPRRHRSGPGSPTEADPCREVLCQGGSNFA